jgi:DNA-binding TFAR19-related protein (PDSD5 family)
MFLLALRQPKTSEMALSNQVKQAVGQAVENLRDALAFSARAEHPITINTLSDILIRLESLEAMEDMMQKLGPKSGEEKNPYRGR